MAEYHATADEARCFRLTEGSRTIGELTYPTWFTFEATLTLPDQPPLQAKPKGFWGTTIELWQQEALLLRFKMGWNGNIILHTAFGGEEQDFVFQLKGFFKNQYVLTNTHQQELLVLQPDFKWKKVTYEFDIATVEAFEELPYKDILLLLTVHLANYYITMMSTTAVIAAT
ncbi:hypothetical protein [Hymenobacter defluvii]|uniref:Uncharacterized protein n=1 Tax=Hymenobacter defluvii TaxID=2054411 RepID=A0ABS3TJ76_9BACT|nr:hypothetical protein [Hymenobacter defluvii]MBO3273458.1 hypothetical protein [Hymenobacter defluvii]